MVSQNVTSDSDHEQHTIDCSFCDQSFEYADVYAQHRSRVHFICPLERCQQQFKSRELQARHWIITQHYYYCHVCDMRCPTAGRLENHEYKIKPEPEEEKITCEVCRMIAPDEETFVLRWQHMRLEASHHINTLELSLEHTICRSCTIRFPTRTKLREHFSDEFGCEECHYHFEDADELTRHKRTHKNVACTTCTLRFHSYSDMLHHVEGGHCTATAQDRIKCYIMDMKQSQSPMLSKAWGYHKRNHCFKPGQKLYYCRYCPEREFPNLGGLFAHV